MQDIYDRRAKNWTLGIVALASFMMALDALIVTTAFATIRQRLQRLGRNAAMGGQRL